MAIIKNKYKDRIDQRIKDFPNGIIPGDFTKKIIYDSETLSNPTILRTPRYGDDLDTTAFSALVSDLVYNDTVINEDGKKHNYIYSNGIIKNYKKEFEVYEKNLFQVLSSYRINQFLDVNQFSLFVPDSIESNFSNNVFCKMYFFTESERLLSEYDFFYKEFSILNITTMTNNTSAIYTDDYSVITFDGQVPNEQINLLPEEKIGIVLYLPISTRNVTPYKSKNYINYLKIGNGALKIGDIFVDIKKDTYISRSIINDNNLNQIKIKNITETKFKDSFRTRRDILIAYYDQEEIARNLIFDGKIDLIVGDEKINRYSPLDSQILTTPRIKKIEYLSINNENFHRIYLDDLCILKGINNNGDEILFRKNNQIFTIRNSIDNVFDGEYIIKNINYIDKTIDFIHPTFDSNYYQVEDSDNIVGYYGHIVPNIYVLYSFLIYKDNGYTSETQIQQIDSIFDNIGLESGITRIEKTVLEINNNNFFEISKDNLKHLKNFNNNLLEYDDAQSLDVPSVMATSFTLTSNISDGDYILNKTEQQLPNEYDEIGANSLSNSHFIITENKFNVINNSKISLSEVYLGIKNSLDSIGTEGIKIKIESVEMLYSLDNPKKITIVEPISNNTEFRFTLSEPDPNIEVGDIIFISNNKYLENEQYFYGNGDYQTAFIKRIDNDRIIIDKILSTYTANFKINTIYPIYFNIIKPNSITKICESLLIHKEIQDQVINGFNGKFSERNSYSKIKFDRFIEEIDPNNDSLKNGITLAQSQDFKIDINKYYFISVAGFVMDNIATKYSSILIEDHNASNVSHFKKSIYYEINIKSFKGRYPNSLIISDEFGDVNVFNINRTFSPFFRLPKYSIMAYDFSNLSVSLNDVPFKDNVILFDPLSGRFKFHPNSTPSRIYLSYYVTENISGASESENFIYKRGVDSNDTLRGKIQEVDNRFIYGTDFKSPISINGLLVDNTLNYKGPFKIKENQIKLKNNANFIDLDINKFEIEIDKNSTFEIIDLQKDTLFLNEEILEKNNEIQSINRQFLDQFTGKKNKNYYEKPIFNQNEEVVFNISEDTTIDQNILSTKKWQYAINQDKNIIIPFLTNKKFNKINFYNFNQDLIIDCYERTKLENLSLEKVNVNDLLKEYVYRKLNEKNYKYALKNDYTENKKFSFVNSNEIKQLNKTFIKDNVYFNKSEIVTTFMEQEDNSLLRREVFEYENLNINKINTNNFILIKDHILNFDFKQINKNYTSSITFFSSSLSYNSLLPELNLINGKLYFFDTAGYNEALETEVEIGDFIVRDQINDKWDFYKSNDFFNVSKISKNEDLSYSLNDFNEVNIKFSYDNFDNSLQKLLLNNSDIIKQNLLKINENMFAIFILIADTSEVYNLYIQIFELQDDNFFYPKKIDGEKYYFKIATSQLNSNLIKIDKNNLFYDFLTIDENRIVFCIMSLEGFIFKYFYLDNLFLDDGIVFINNKNIKNIPKLLLLNNEIFSVIFNSEKQNNYDTSIGDLEIKIFNIENKNNIIFSYKENSTSLSSVDKIIIDTIKNGSNFNHLKLIDDKIIIFYSKVDSLYLNNISLNDEEWSSETYLSNLNCFKTINFLKTDDSYIFEVSPQRTVFYQNLNEAIFPPKIYPFKITNNIFGVNYIQIDLNNNQTGNRLYTFNIDGVLQKEYFSNDLYSQNNSLSIKNIFNFNNRQAIEIAQNKVIVHNFNNDYSQLIKKEDINYKKYFSNIDYDMIFQNKISNPIEIKTIKNIDGEVFDKKIITYFTKENNIFKLNIGIIDNLSIDFSNIQKINVSPDNGSMIEEDGYIIYQNDILYLNNKIYLAYVFLIEDLDLSVNRLFIYLVDIGSKLSNNNLVFSEISDFTTINEIKISNYNKNKFFFNKISNSMIEIICLREFNVNGEDSDLISKFTFSLLNENGSHEFLENRGVEGYNETDKTIDYIVPQEDFNITNIYKINYNDNIKCIFETYKSISDIDNYNYFYIKQDDFQIFNFFTLINNNLNINYANYDVSSKELLMLGDENNEIVDYIFNFNTNIYTKNVIENINNNKYNFFKIEDTDKDCIFYYKISDTILNTKIFLKKENEDLLLAYNNSYDFHENISDIAFNNYNNIYETFIKFPINFIRSIWEIFPMNSISQNKNILNNEIYENRVHELEKYKNIFPYSSVDAVIEFNQTSNENYIYVISDEEILKKIYGDITGLRLYCNNDGNLCVFNIGEKNDETGYYSINYLIGENTKNSLLNKRKDFYIYYSSDYSFYRKSYQSVSFKINMFNYKGEKRNEYEIYRKNNYFYETNAVYEDIKIYESNAYIIKGDYKDLEIIYNLKDEYEKTAIYVKKYLIINNSMYSFNEKNKILIDNYDDNDDITFICEKLNNSNIFISFKKNDSYVYNYILNKDFGFEELDPDFSRRELYKFITIKDISNNNILQEIENYKIEPFFAKKLFNGYLLFLLKITNNNVTKIVHILYKEDGFEIDYYNDNYQKSYVFPNSDDIIGYSNPNINSFGYTSLFIYKNDSSKDILQFGIDGEGGICKLKGINNLF